MEKKEFMQKLTDLFLEKKKLSMKGENTEIIDKQIKDLKEENLSLRQLLSFWKDKFLKVISLIKDKLFGKEKEREKYMDVAEDLYSKLHNINLLEIWYYDINKIEEIMTKALGLKLSA